MRVAVRTLLVAAVFVGVGWGIASVVMHHAGVGTPVAQVRLSAAMAGLFAGGAAAVVVGIAVVWGTANAKVAKDAEARKGDQR